MVTIISKAVLTDFEREKEGEREVVITTRLLDRVGLNLEKLSETEMLSPLRKSLCFAYHARHKASRNMWTRNPCE